MRSVWHTLLFNSLTALALLVLASCDRGLIPDTPTSSVPTVYYAAFGLGFSEGAWQEGQTYDYFLELKSCDTDNFTGSPFKFGVDTASNVPFYLLKDGLYDHPDRNVARPTHASSSQKSYAIVILPKALLSEAEQALQRCTAFISINDGPRMLLEPLSQGPIPGFGPDGVFEFDADVFSVVPGS